MPYIVLFFSQAFDLPYAALWSVSITGRTKHYTHLLNRPVNVTDVAKLTYAYSVESTEPADNETNLMTDNSDDQANKAAEDSLPVESTNFTSQVAEDGSSLPVERTNYTHKAFKQNIIEYRNLILPVEKLFMHERFKNYRHDIGKENIASI